jgi:glycosyltransferase involved in cell wall biosynthesis
VRAGFSLRSLRLWGSTAVQERLIQGYHIKTGVITFDFFPYIGGIGRFTYLMHKELGQQDFLFFSPTRNDLPGHVRVDFWLVPFLKQVGVSIWFFFHARRIIAGHGLANLNIHAGPGGVLNVRKLPVPVIVTCHHTYWQQYTYIKSQFWKRIFLPFEKRTYRLADRIICDCEDTKRVLIERYAVAPDKISVVYCAVDTGRFHPTELPKQPDLAVYIGRIEKRKGIDFLIRSMPLVREQIPGVRLLVGGKGSYLEKMKLLVRELKLEENVTFLGFVPDDQLNALYNSAQCAVVPSVFEGFGITVIEALAAGTRVVGTDVDGIREILQSGDFGRLAPYGDERALARAIVAELQAPRSAPALGPQYRVEQVRSGYRKALIEHQT